MPIGTPKMAVVGDQQKVADVRHHGNQETKRKSMCVGAMSGNRIALSICI